MKEIIYNYDYLQEDEINQRVYRAKAVLVNSNNEILLAWQRYNYQLPGGHLEENETVDHCLSREVLEETGINIPVENRKPFFVVTYYCKDYPEMGDNTKYIANYYEIETDERPDLNKINLTEEEKNGMFKLQYFAKETILEELTKSIDESTSKNVVLDTIEVIKEYLKRQ